MEITDILNKIDIDKLKLKKESLESQATIAYQTGENIATVTSDLKYTSDLFSIATSIATCADNIKQANEILASESDMELISMAKDDIESSTLKANELYSEYRKLQIERELGDPDDNRAVIMEIRAGAGGEEAALFAHDIFNMYALFCKNKGWEYEIIDSSESENGGLKEIIFHIKGKNVYKYLKYEMGVHRVQRIPSTESAGRIHTSTASVAVLPEAQEIDVEIKPQDIRIDVMRASGAGGQCVNKTDSAVRITHMESGIVVSCQETKHQDQNKEKAMALLRSRLYEKRKAEEHAKRAQMRSSQIGSSMRAEKIRTYNFPQTRITDHRIKKSWFNVESILGGNIEEMINDISTAILNEQLEKISKENGENI